MQRPESSKAFLADLQLTIASPASHLPSPISHPPSCTPHTLPPSLLIHSFHPIIEMATSIRSIRSLVPLLDRVLVQRIKAETKTASGIFLPESSVKELNEAKVLAVGPGALSKDGARVPMGVAQGDRVLIPQYGGSPVKVGEEEFHLFRDSEILAKINE
ncbi:chaperonin 10-like protein [Xylariaceae sp. FL1272]|nr:chaperonin 10-like protein [Xylariaceae sp. FL1272]